MSNDSFKSWLENTIGYQKRTSRDVQSRLNRASKYIDLSSKSSDEELIFSLSQHSEFMSTCASVKSQIRKSIRLYKQYQKETGL